MTIECGWVMLKIVCGAGLCFCNAELLISTEFAMTDWLECMPTHMYVTFLLRLNTYAYIMVVWCKFTCLL